MTTKTIQKRTDQVTWQEQMRAELEAMDPVERFAAAGRWLAEVTHDVLPYLGHQRREALLTALDAELGHDVTWFAELVGSSPGAIDRLAQEGRRIRRRESKRYAEPAGEFRRSLHPTPPSL